MPDEFYGILVEVGPPKPICFIAIPFSDDFKEVSECLQMAATHCGLTPTFMDDQVTGLDFVNMVWDGTRSARMVVGVCTPEKRSGVANPNVMYELGLAHSLGKPTLQLSTTATLPANIRNISSLIYKPKDIPHRGKFLLRLENAMRTILGQSCDGLTVKDTEGISVIHAADRRLFNPAFWGSFQAILGFVNEAHLEVQGIKLFHLDDLWRAAHEMAFADRARVMDSVREFTMKLELYRQGCIERTRGRVAELEARCPEVESSFDDLLTDTACGMRTCIEDGRECFRRIRTQLARFLAIHDQVVGGEGLISSAKARMHAYNQAVGLAETTHLIVKDASAVMQNLIGMITQGPHGVSPLVTTDGAAPRKPAAMLSRPLARAKGASR